MKYNHLIFHHRCTIFSYCVWRVCRMATALVSRVF